MTFVERIRALVNAGDPNGTVTLGWLSEQLGADSEPHIEAIASAVEVDLTVRQVAELFERGASTVRLWLTNNEFPNAYRLQGKEWRIPRSDIEAMQRRQREAVRAPRAKTDAAARNSAELGDWRKHIQPKAAN